LEEYSTRIGIVALTSASYATFPLTTPFVMVGLIGASEFGYGFAGAPPPGYGDVVIHERVDKMGVRTELVTAKNASALTTYLSERGLVLPRDSLVVLDDYISKDYSFVITTVQNVTEYREQFPEHSRGISGHVYEDSGSDDVMGVSVRFPADRVYFPLKPTNVYGSREIPLLLTINGHVTPQFPEGVKPHVTVDYLLDPSYTPPDELKHFFNNHGIVSPWPYTKIMITGPAANYTDDLWMDAQVPPDVTFKLWMIRYYPLIGIGLYILLSAIAALLAGLVVFTKGSVSSRQLVQHGFWNCATMIGFVYATRRFLILSEEEGAKRVRFVLAFYAIFLILLTAINLILAPALFTIVLVSPLVILLIAFFGLEVSADRILTTIFNRALYMPDDLDKALLFGTALIILAFLVVWWIVVRRGIVQYLIKK
jgi:Ni,Fe-hydrogenase I cytochrome b subunit